METCNFKQYFHDFILGFGERVQCRVPNRLIGIPMREHELNTAENPIISISTILAIFYFHFFYASAIIFFTYWTLVNEKKLEDQKIKIYDLLFSQKKLSLISKWLLCCILRRPSIVGASNSLIVED